MARKQSAKKEAQDKINLQEKGKATRFKAGETQGKKEAAEKANKVQRRRRNMREDIKSLLSMPLEASVLADIEELRALSELKTSNITAQEAMLYQLVVRAIKKGDKEAIKLIYEMSGDNREESTDNDVVLAFIRGMME